MAHGSECHVVDRLSGHGEWGPGVLGFGRAVEGDDSDVFRRPEPRLSKSTQDADTLEVGACEDGRGRVGGLEQATRSFVATFSTEVGSGDRPVEQLCRTKRGLPPTYPSIGAGPAIVSDHQSYLLVTVHGDEVLDDQPCTFGGIGADGETARYRDGRVHNDDAAAVPA